MPSKFQEALDSSLVRVQGGAYHAEVDSGVLAFANGARWRAAYVDIGWRLRSPPNG
jgi:hypothetical protein